MVAKDILTPEQRSERMSRIRGKDTTPEITLRKALWHRGYRYRLHYKLPGKPDLVFISAKLAIFVDGCFWHGCPIHGRTPDTNPEFLARKFQDNIDRDKRVTQQLEESGWAVLRFWEHEIKDDLEGVIACIETGMEKA